MKSCALHGQWVKNINFAGSQKIEKELSKASENIENYFSTEGHPIGEVSNQIANLAKNIHNNNETNETPPYVMSG